MNGLVSTRSRGAAAVLCAAIVLLAVVPGFCLAAPYGWEGGHDVTGWSGPARSLYFAEGTTRNGFEEYLVLRNPSDEAAAVTVDYLFTGEPPAAQALEIPPRAGASISVNDAVGPDRDVSVSVTSSRGIVGERQMYFNYKGAWTGGHASRGVAAPSRTWYFAEGTTRDGFAEWLCLQNPSDSDTEATVTYYLATGENRAQPVALKADSRQTIDVNAVVGGGQDVSVSVHSAAPIIAERPMYFDYKSAWRGGHTACGSESPGTEWYFAEGTTRTGFEEYLCVLNPGQETTVRVEYLFAGQSASVCEYVLRARARTTFFVNEAVGADRDVSIKVTCPREILCERPMYFCYHLTWEGGHDVLGSREGARTWLFPTTGTGPGFEPWLCVMNPTGTGNPVTVEVFGDGGGCNRQELVMPGRSRCTVDLSAASVGLQNPWLKVTAGGEVIVERPTYFSYAPKAEPAAFSIARWGDVEIMSPIRYCDMLGPVFHEASAGNGCPPMQPVGVCLRDDNPGMRAPGITADLGSDPFFFIESSRRRGTYSTTACDIQAKAGTVVYAPVTGLVATADSYLLYGRYPDLRVRIAIDSHPGYQMAVLHMQQLLVSAGQWVEAGRTPIGVVRDLVPYFDSGPNPYTRDDGNHAHIQINGPAGSGSGAEQP